MRKNKILIFIMSMIFIIAITIGCTKKIEKLPLAIIDIEGFGIIKAELYPNEAPNTVNNFISLSKSGFYDGLKLTRITENVIQGGGSLNGPNYTIKGEFKDNSLNNTVTHTRGTLSMVRSGDDKNSASSQFFILKKDVPTMDGVNAAFGRVIEGMDVVDEIGSVEVNSENNKPKKDIIIKSITVETYGTNYKNPNVIND